MNLSVDFPRPVFEWEIEAVDAEESRYSTDITYTFLVKCGTAVVFSTSFHEDDVGQNYDTIAEEYGLPAFAAWLISRLYPASF